MSWPEALAFIASMGALVWVLTWVLWLRHRTLVEAMKHGYEEESGYALPIIPDHRPLWTQTTRPKDPPPAKVGQGGKKP